MTPPKTCCDWREEELNYLHNANKQLEHEKNELMNILDEYTNPNRESKKM